MLMRSLALTLSVALVALFISSAAQAAEPPFVIPSIESMTGAGAFSGKETEETLRRLETGVNRQGGIKGRPIHFEIYDDQSKPQVSVQLLSQIMAGGSQVVLGPAAHQRHASPSFRSCKTKSCSTVSRPDSTR